jgi:hypothetical protein
MYRNEGHIIDYSICRTSGLNKHFMRPCMMIVQDRIIRRLSTFSGLEITEHNPVKFHIGGLHQKLLGEFNFGSYQSNITLFYEKSV